MSDPASLLAAACLAVVVVAAGLCAHYYFSGWTSFTFTSSGSSSAPPAWPRPGDALTCTDASRLRFKGVTFTSAVPGAPAASVTAVLNGMAAAYRGATATPPTSLALDAPLNPFSFAVPGFNDPATVAEAGDTPTGPPWCTSYTPATSTAAGSCAAWPTTTLSGFYRVL